MKHSKNIIATVLICGVFSTVAFAAAKAPLWTLNGQTVKTKTDNEGTWVLVPKNFDLGILINESNRKLKLTEENFTKANKVGNTYEAVCKILGGKGELQSKTIDTNSDGEKQVFCSYDWNDGKIRVYMQFTNGKITDTMFNEFEQDCRKIDGDQLSLLEQIKPKQ